MGEWMDGWKDRYILLVYEKINYSSYYLII